MKALKSLSIAVILVSLSATVAMAAELTPVGLWKTIDDKTGKPRSLIRIVESNGEFSAIVEKGLKEGDTGESVCDKCKDERKGKKIIGMTIAKGLKKDGDQYQGGEILDPENGKVYRCKMKLKNEGNQLEVRGYIGISLLGRSQIWNRVE
jgi:uncharacterized protein (DUF2147 family)